MRGRLALAAAAAALGGAAGVVLDDATGAAGGTFTARGTVTSVVDGDTVDVRLRGGALERVRLIGIDTPERGECGDSAATAAARSLAGGRAVLLRGDATQATRDRYGRLLAYVWIDGRRDLGFQLLVRGFGRVYVYDRPFQRLGAYRHAETVARRAGRGEWTACAVAP